MPDIQIGIQVVGADQATRQLKNVGDAAKDAGSKTKTAGSDFAAMGKNVLGLAGGVGLITSAIFGMEDALDNVTRSDIKADKANRTLQEALQKRNKIQAELNGVMNQGLQIQRNSNGEVSLTEESQKSLFTTMADGTKWYTTANGELRMLNDTTTKSSGLQQQLADANRDVSIAQENAAYQTNQSSQAHQRLIPNLLAEGLQLGTGALAAATFAKSMFGVGTSAAGAAISAKTVGSEIESLAGKAGGAKGALSGMFVGFGLGLAVLKTAQAALGELQGAIKGFAAGSKGDMKAVLEGFNQMISSIKDLPLFAAGPIATLLDQFHLLPTVSQQDAAKVIGFWKSVGTAFAPIGQSIAQGIDFIVKGFNQFASQLSKGDIKGALDTLVGGIEQGFKGLAAAASASLSGGAATIGAAFSKWVTGIPGWLAGGTTAVATAVGNWVVGVATAISKGAIDLAMQFGIWITKIPGWLSGGVTAVATAIGNWVVGVSTAISRGAIDLAIQFGIWITKIPGWLAGGVTAVATAIGNWVVGVATAISRGAIDLAIQFGIWITKIPGWLAGGATAVGSAIGNWIVGVATAISRGAIDLAIQFGIWITKIPGWLAGGATAIGSAIAGWMTNLAASFNQGAINLSVQFAIWITKIGSWLSGGGQAISDAIAGWVNTIRLPDFGNIGRAIWQALVFAFKQAAGVGGLVTAANVKLAQGGTYYLTGTTSQKIQQILAVRQALAKQQALAPIIGGTSIGPVPQSLKAPPAPVNYAGGQSLRAPPANVGGRSTANPATHMAQGGSVIVTQPTQLGNLIVGEGHRPELLTYVPLGGTSGAGILNVTPLAGNYAPKQTGMASGGNVLAMGSWSGSSSSSNWDNRGGGGSSTQKLEARFARLIAILEKMISVQSKGLQANLIVDGQRMASVTGNYLSSKSYGDR